MAMMARSPEAASKPNTTCSWPSKSRISKRSIAHAPPTAGASTLPAATCTARDKGCPLARYDESFIALPASYARWAMQADLDRGDARILDLIQEHGDLSAAEIAERLGMTASTCWRRVSRLQELGVIRKRVALLDREKVGLNVLVFSHVKLAGHGRDALLKFEQA